MLLTLSTRQVGRVTVVHCTGRIIAGQESEALHAHINELLIDRRSILLNMGDVVFVDSSGLGTLVRGHANARQARGELRLCNVPEPVRRILEMTCLTSVFHISDTEENALTAFYSDSSDSATKASCGRSVLCFDANLNVLAYLRELLRGAGYEVQTATLARDARVLMQVWHFDVVLVGPDKMVAGQELRSFGVPMLELGSDFSTRDAGEAGAALLAEIESSIQPAH